MAIRRSFLVTVLLLGVCTGNARGDQQVAGQPQAAAQVAQCQQAQPRVRAALEAALKRLDEARQTNSPAAMRAASDDVQTALLDVRAQLVPCAEMQVAAADSHAGHTMPTVPGSTAPAPAATAPAPPAPAADAGHAAAGAPSSAQPRATAQLRITFRTVPTPPRGAAENEMEVTVVRDGKPVDGADVSVLWFMAAMPAMKMPEMRNEVKLKGGGGGKYTGKGHVVMAGPWNVTVSVKQNGKEIGQQKVAVTAK